jgi:hypothetical protein
LMAKEFFESSETSENAKTGHAKNVINTVIRKDLKMFRFAFINI